MYRFLFISVLLLSAQVGFAQKLSPKVIASGGGFRKGSAITVGYTIGESFISVHKSASKKVTEGFQGAATTNPKLINLSISKGSLTPVFNRDSVRYRTTVTSDVSSLTVTPTASASTVKITVNDSTVVSGSASRPINIYAGFNTIKVVVAGSDLTKKTYTITVEKPDPESIVTFQGKVFLQGAYNANTGLMTNTLNTSGILKSQAISQPYGAIYNYQGQETVGTNFFASNPNIVDWVLLELRESQNPAVVVAARAVFVKRDGTLVETDGTSNTIYFQGILPTSYHVSIRHRNHLGVRTFSPLNFVSGGGSYDFTTAGNKAWYQGTTSTVQLGSIWALRGGNANFNNNIKYNGPGNDQDRIQNTKLGGSLSLVLANQYATEDVNMDGIIKTNGPANDQNFLLNTVLQGFLSYIYGEQL